MALNRPATFLITSALCGAVTIGFAGPSAAAAVQDRPTESIVANAVAPDPAALLGQADVLSKLGLVGPLGDLLKEALAAKPDPAKVKELAEKVTKAITDAGAAAPAAPALPGVPALPGLGGSPADRAAAADPVADALKALQAKVTELLAAVTSADPAKILAAVTGTVTTVIPLILGLLTKLPLPVPLPPLPALPAAPALPAPLPV
ncbi:MAG TPA: hypothetical protein VFH94_01050 [Streptomyces sp.]|nr:hypothetical protein [Streptomyces sp.]